MDQEILTVVNNSIVALITILGAITTAIWFSMIIWTFKDMRSRSRDIFAQILAAVLSAVLPVVGIFVYLLLRPNRTLADSFEMAIEQEVLLQEIETKRNCPNCKRKAKGNWVLCPHCHVQLQAKCRFCGELKDMGWAMCPACADGVLDPIPQPQLAERNAYRNPQPRFEKHQGRTILIDDAPAQPLPVSDRVSTSDHLNREEDYVNGRLKRPMFDRYLTPHGNGKQRQYAPETRNEVPSRQSIPNVPRNGAKKIGESQVRLAKKNDLRQSPTYRNGN